MSYSDNMITVDHLATSLNRIYSTISNIKTGIYTFSHPSTVCSTGTLSPYGGAWDISDFDINACNFVIVIPSLANTGKTMSTTNNSFTYTINGTGYKVYFPVTNSEDASIAFPIQPYTFAKDGSNAFYCTNCPQAVTENTISIATDEELQTMLQSVFG